MFMVFVIFVVTTADNLFYRLLFIKGVHEARDTKSFAGLNSFLSDLFYISYCQVKCNPMSAGIVKNPII